MEMMLIVIHFINFEINFNNLFMNLLIKYFINLSFVNYYF